MAQKKMTGGLPPHRKVGQTMGDHPLKSSASIARNGRGAIEGTSIARHRVVKPSSSSGTIGEVGALKTTSGYQDKKLTTLGRSYLKTKVSK